ncbi:MAG: serine/threonine protein kinase, partial [Deltaproteobacteria bacterium]|nr:serine/threonine protein kinase [Deltaproteobacteria bacterium]MBW2532764.1 serine/threonine protein kinase [Deltaproteobacteria bacterium]
MQTSDASQVLTLGRYALHAEIASGGMATVYLGRLQGPVGFSKVVAIKRMHPHIAHDPDFAVMFMDEAALAARIQHPNVVATLDVVSQDGELFIVMEYVKGPSLAALLRDGKKRIKTPLDITLGMMTGVLAGLHAAHEATSESGAALNIVHRDVSPQNVLVGLDGLPKILDFGVAKAAVRAGVTRNDQVKGKLCYMSPEQMSGRVVDRRADLFAAAAVVWEMLAGRRLFRGDDAGALVAQILSGQVPPLGEFRDDVPPAVEEVIRRALKPNPAQRYDTAQAFADALEAAAPKLATPRALGSWVKRRAADLIEQREELISSMRSSPQPAPEGAGGQPESQHSGVKPGPAAAPALAAQHVPTAGAGQQPGQEIKLPKPRPPRSPSLAEAPIAATRQDEFDEEDYEVTRIQPPLEDDMPTALEGAERPAADAPAPAAPPPGAAEPP